MDMHLPDRFVRPGKLSCNLSSQRAEAKPVSCHDCSHNVATMQVIHHGGHVTSSISDATTHIIVLDENQHPADETHANLPEAEHASRSSVTAEMLLKAIAEKGGGLPALTALRASLLSEQAHIVSYRCDLVCI